MNAYYLGWWSLTHFLRHCDDGSYASGYRRLIEEGGSVPEFEQAFGPVGHGQAEWYAHLGEGCPAYRGARQGVLGEAENFAAGMPGTRHLIR